MPNADSVYLTPIPHPDKADILVSDFRAVQSPIDTYWALQNWNQGDKMGGYAGIQQSSDKGRVLIMSLRDHPEVKKPNELVYCSPCGTFEAFGGEGTGMKIMTPYQYQLNQWYRMVIRSWQDNRGTCVGQWVADLGTSRWSAIAAMRFPVTGLALGGTLELFQENWTATHENVREAHITNSWSRTDGAWCSWATQKAKGSNDLRDWDGGATQDYFWIKAGGDTKPSNEEGIEGRVNPTYDPREVQECRVKIGAVKYDVGVVHVQWNVEDWPLPQFSCELKVLEIDRVAELANWKSTNPFCSQVNVQVPGGLKHGTKYKIELAIVNLFDQKSSVSLIFEA